MCWRRWKTPGVYLLLVSLYVKSVLAQMEDSDARLKTDCVLDTSRYIASIFMGNMKTEIDPCEDFYQFACGNFIKKIRIPQGRGYVNTITMLKDLYKMQLANIVTEEVTGKVPEYLRYPNYFYKACMNTTLIESLGSQPIKEISDSLGGWPVLVGDSWNSDNSWAWQELAKRQRHLGFSTNYIFTFSVTAGPKHTNRPIINLDKPDLVNEPDFYNKYMQKYFTYTVEIAELFGVKRSHASRELWKAIQFEADLARITWIDEQKNITNESYNLLSIKELQKLHPYVDWLDLINGLLPKHIKVDENEMINLSAPNFFKNLGKLLESTDKRIIANYMMWYIHAFSVGFLSKQFRNRSQQFNSMVEDYTDIPDTQHDCLEVPLENLPILVASLYMRKHHKRNPKPAVLEMVENIRQAFSQTLDEVQWMDYNTKTEAKKKLDIMEVVIGFPDEIMDYDALDEYYRNLEIDPNKYFQSYLNMKAFEMDKFYGKLRKAENEADWLGQFQLKETEVSYYVEANSIELPAAILQEIFFGKQHPKYMNYGALGSIIGHEITHGFCGDGFMYDAEGNMGNWWQPATENRYWEKANCMIDQYGSYVDQQTGFKLDGARTLEENIADNNGVKLAYLAYKNWLTENGEEARLPDLNYTSQQMFWISFAQASCAKYRKGSLQLHIIDDEHSPEEYRVLVPLRNMEEFSRDFQCPENSPMNPSQKCKIW